MVPIRLRVPAGAIADDFAGGAIADPGGALPAAAAHDPARAAMVRVGRRVDAGPGARLLGRNAPRRTDTGRADLHRPARHPTCPAVVYVVGRVDAHPAAGGRPGSANASTGITNAATGTLDAASTTVQRVGCRIDTARTACGPATRTACPTAPGRTDLVDGADDATSAAVGAVAGDVDTPDRTAVGVSRRTPTRTVSALEPPAADIAASPAVHEVAPEIHAGSGAIRQPHPAGAEAFAAGTHIPHRARGPAGTAVCGVRGKVGAGHPTLDEATTTDAHPVGAGLPQTAGRAARTTVVLVAVDVDAGVPAVREAWVAARGARPDAAHLGAGAGVGASPAVGRVTRRVDAGVCAGEVAGGRAEPGDRRVRCRIRDPGIEAPRVGHRRPVVAATRGQEGQWGQDTQDGQSGPTDGKETRNHVSEPITRPSNARNTGQNMGIVAYSSIRSPTSLARRRVPPMASKQNGPRRRKQKAKAIKKLARWREEKADKADKKAPPKA